MSHWKQQVMFDSNYLALQRELMHESHVDLLKQLHSLRADDFELKMSAIASHCDVILDGDYTDQEMAKLAGILTEKLVSKRTGFIFPKMIAPKNINQ